jgi:Glycosyl hydrolase family 99
MRGARTRRDFLSQGLRAGAALAATPWLAKPAGAATPDPAELRRLYPDLERHFVFEYYPWYGGAPDYTHWDYLERQPPADLASRYVPQLGAYDVRSTAVLEQHAAWIREAGVGAVALSWWGRGSFEDRAVPLVLDVLHAHGLKATFALEPYGDDRARRYADDVLYLLSEYGERRHWDCFLLLRDATGRFGPVFKSFRTVLPDTSTDCLGETHPVSDFTTDGFWRSQTDALRETLRNDFDHVTLLADSLEFARTPAAGFDGVGIYDNFIPPESYRGFAEGASRAGLLFSFNVNPGYDQIEPRHTGGDPCYSPRDVAPPLPGVDLDSAAGHEREAEASAARVRASWQETLAVQLDPELLNARRGFLLVYVNSFNEWHEGHAFEPMKDAASLSPEERALGYRNPERGDYRLRTLAELQRSLLDPSLDERPRSVSPAA